MDDNNLKALAQVYAKERAQLEGALANAGRTGRKLRRATAALMKKNLKARAKHAKLLPAKRVAYVEKTLGRKLDPTETHLVKNVPADHFIRLTPETGLLEILPRSQMQVEKLEAMVEGGESGIVSGTTEDIPAILEALKSKVGPEE